MEVFDIKYCLDLGISLTEQGYSIMDYDILQILKYITQKEAQKMKDKQNSNQNIKGFKRFR